MSIWMSLALYNRLVFHLSSPLYFDSNKCVKRIKTETCGCIAFLSGITDVVFHSLRKN